MEAEDFITEFEYGQMLYQNPRGASCAACHGDTGEGKIIASYQSRDGKNITLQGPDIRNVSLEQMRESIRKGRGVMPRYFLTDDEVRTLHAYLQRVNQAKKGKISALFSPEEPRETSSAK